MNKDEFFQRCALFGLFLQFFGQYIKYMENDTAQKFLEFATVETADILEAGEEYLTLATFNQFKESLGLIASLVEAVANGTH